MQKALVISVCAKLLCFLTAMRPNFVPFGGFLWLEHGLTCAEIPVWKTIKIGNGYASKLYFRRLCKIAD